MLTRGPVDGENSPTTNSVGWGDPPSSDPTYEDLYDMKLVNLLSTCCVPVMCVWCLGYKDGFVN